MTTSPFSILLIESIDEKNSSLTKLLSEIGYNIILIPQIERALEVIANGSADLVIFKSTTSRDTGFTALKRLRPFLVKAGIPYILYLKAFDKVEFLVGLEMGVDNFIIPPFDKDSVKFKVENELKKKMELDVFDTESFKFFFQSSLVAMFYISNNKIESANPAFCLQFSNDFATMLGQPINEIFNVYGNEDNELQYRRFRSGITHTCVLKNIVCFHNTNQSFNINLYRGNKMNISSVVGEILPADDNPNRSCGINSMCRESADYALRDNAASERLDVFNFTKQEKHIYVLSSQGLAIKQIADKLNISQRTVEKHRSNIMHKTNSSSFIETIAKLQESSI